MDEVRARFDIDAEEAEEDVRFRRVEGLMALGNPERIPGACFFFARDASLVAIYVGSGPLLEGLRPSELAASLGPPAAELVSRQGDAFVQRVYPAHGVALADDESTVAALELFPPTTLEDYLERLWDDPGPRPVR